MLVEYISVSKILGRYRSYDNVSYVWINVVEKIN